MARFRQHDQNADFLAGVQAAEDQLKNSGQGFVGYGDDEKPLWQTDRDAFTLFWNGYHSVLNEETAAVKAINDATVLAFFQKFPELSLRDK